MLAVAVLFSIILVSVVLSKIYRDQFQKGMDYGLLLYADRKRLSRQADKLLEKTGHVINDEEMKKIEVEDLQKEIRENEEG